jgi:hypothetical protein
LQLLPFKKNNGKLLFTFFYFLEYNLFNQPTQKSLYGDLSITGLVGDSLERQALSSIAF